MSDEKKGAVLTGEELGEIARLEKEATPGPWFIEGAHMDYAVMGNRTGSQDGWAIADNVIDLDARRKPEDVERQVRDAALILALRNAAPALLESARLARLAAELFREHGEHFAEVMRGQRNWWGYNQERADECGEALRCLESTIAAFRKGAE